MFSPSPQLDILVFGLGPTVEEGPVFPYLNMELKWDRYGHLSFGVHLKAKSRAEIPKQGQLPHKRVLQSHSAINTGVWQCLAKLTSCTAENSEKRLGKLYLVHFQALNKARLANDKCPKLLRSKRKSRERRKQKFKKRGIG